MHIADGVLSAPVLAAGAALGVAGVAVGLRRLKPEQVPQTAVLSSAFFVASLIHVPIGPTSTHLLLTGLLGIILGWAVFPAVLVALLLQFVFFGHGGITTLGVNLVNMAGPGLICYYLFSRGINSGRKGMAPAFAIAAGAAGVCLACVFMGLSLYLSAASYLPVIGVALVYHIPVAVIEGLVTGAAVSFLKQVRPEILTAGRPANSLEV